MLSSWLSFFFSSLSLHLLTECSKKIALVVGLHCPIANNQSALTVGNSSPLSLITCERWGAAHDCVSALALAGGRRAGGTQEMIKPGVFIYVLSLCCRRRAAGSFHCQSRA